MVDHTPLNTPKSTTILSSICLDGRLAFTTFQGGTTGNKFLTYLKDVLIPTLRPGDIVVMDNLRTHHIQAVGVKCAWSRKSFLLIFLSISVFHSDL